MATRSRLSAQAVTGLFAAWAFVVSSRLDGAVRTIAPASYKTISGTDDGEGRVACLAERDQSGSDDDRSRYLRLLASSQSEYRGWRSYFLPGAYATDSLLAVQVRANVRAEYSSRQSWEWSIYNWQGKKWERLAANERGSKSAWRFFTMNVVGVPTTYVRQDTGEIRVLIESSSFPAAAWLDYEAVVVACDAMPPPLPLGAVSSWGYQIQKIAARGAVDALVASHYDLLVIEPTRTDWSSADREFDTRSMVSRLKKSFAGDGEHRKLILAYIDIGEAEDWRWYWTWSTDYDCDGPLPEEWPSFIVACDPDGWGGTYPVAYWDSRWKDIAIYGNAQSSHPYGNYSSILDETIKDGFDGIYLDWVEAFSNDAVIDAAAEAGKDPATEMIAFIRQIREYARARRPGFLLVQQNAPELLDGHPELTSVIDALAQEAVWYDGDATDSWEAPDGHDSVNAPILTKWYLRWLKQYRDAGVPVFDCEYALDYADHAYEKSRGNEFIPYATRRSLGRLTTTPPPEY